MRESQDGDRVKIVVALERDEDDYPPVEYENLWSTPVGKGLFRVDNIPFFAHSIALGDLVAATPEGGALRFKEVVQASGHSTLRLIVYDEAEVPKILEHFRQKGCLSERSHIPGLIALDVPPAVSLAGLQRELELGQAQERWDYEEACIGQPIS
ncbi:DUF4265 domain-containing protein [Stigmatella sp. ncwal1]|uniref:DUF4265 domain-containing protein n=1 Tax=Stigmatella ashevillensis TaxID=2995309 RepID=A0ABT5DBQ3_9BACT|nr:DUF4265 domain-containing protein [Stigmatella ashevillena]MDC0711105.1 DUF4265 domain-containing protein [Stigmatella ashevillena]